MGPDSQQSGSTSEVRHSECVQGFGGDVILLLDSHDPVLAGGGGESAELHLLGSGLLRLSPMGPGLVLLSPAAESCAIQPHL